MWGLPHCRRTGEAPLSQAAGEALPSPWPPRRYGWVAEYTDGQTLREIYAEPPLTPWEEVAAERLGSLVLEDVWPTGEDQVLRLDCGTGVVHARGRALTFRVGDVAITEREGVYRDVLQYKKAHTDYRPGQGSTTQIDAYYLGYQRALPELDAKILVRLNPRTRELGIEAELDLHRTLGGEFQVLVDGTPVDTQRAFRDAVGVAGVG